MRLKSLNKASRLIISILILLTIPSCTKPALPTITISPSAEQTENPPGSLIPILTNTQSTQPTSEISATIAAPTQVISQTATPEPCSPTTQGLLANIDPRGQTITWWHQQSGDNGDALVSLVLEFNASNNCKISVDPQYQGGYSDLRNEMNTAIDTGTLPGLVSGYQNDEAAYASVGSLVDINPYMSDQYWGLSDSDVADFYPEFLNQGVHPAYDNMRLGFPPNRSAEVLYYNLTWLKELGFDGPPSSPEEFKTMACAASASKDDGTGGFILNPDASAIASWTYAYGGDLLSSDSLRYVYNGQETIDAMTFLKGLHDEGCIYQTDQYPDIAFSARQAIFTEGSTTDLFYYTQGVADAATKNNRPADEWGVAAIPHTTPIAYTNVYGGDVMIPATTPEKQLAAWIFIKWFTQPDIMARWDEASGYFPTRRSAGDFMTEYIATNNQYNKGLALLQASKYEPQLISYQQVRDLASQAFTDILDGADITTTLNKLTDQANALQAELQPSP